MAKKNKGVFEKSFVENIFSMKNKSIYKIITIFGFEFTINRTLFVKHYYNLPIDKNKIVFSNYLGNGFGCNPKYIAEEIIKRKLPYKLVWLAKNTADLKDMPKEIKVVNYKDRKAIKELVTAKLWVDNYHKISKMKIGLHKRENQIFIQTWHGSLGIKKIEKQVKCLTEDRLWKKYAIKNSRMTDYWISNSSFETDVYKNSFWDVKNIKEFGHPRNDIFFSQTNDIANRVKSYYNIPLDQSVLLYAPSFREDEELTPYQINYDLLKQTLEEKTNKEWIILTRLHPRVAQESKDLLKKENNVIDASSYPDIQELLVSADAMITDYSSCIFDFMLSRKPGFIFATDIDAYNTERGFYYPLESTPFPIARNNDELMENIKKFDLNSYKNKVETFLKDKGCIEDGHASERVVDLIEEIMHGKKV